MRKKLALGLVLLAGCAGRAAAPANPALALWRHYEPGAPAAYALNPYLNNVLALYLLNGRSRPAGVAEYLQWYLDRLNYPDKHGLTGSIYDFYITREGAETRGAGYDSVDSYAATFLLALRRYYAAAGDAALPRRNWAKVKDVAYTIAYLQDKDGLVRALPDSDGKYLMDNCECYAGLTAYQELSEALGYGRDPYYDTVAASIKKGVLETFYDGKSGTFSWGMAGGVKTGCDTDKAYPDALAQIFPFLYGLTDDDAPLRGFLAKHGAALGALPLEQRLIVEMARRRLRER